MPAIHSIFATIGSTEFDPFINSILSASFLSALVRNNVHLLTIQAGSSSLPDLSHCDSPNPISKSLQSAELSSFSLTFKKSLHIHLYSYKSSIAKDILSADLVLSHAGSGSILESLDLKKPLIVIINDSLMDNHQLELANKLRSLHLIHLCPNPNDLTDTVTNFIEKYNLSSSEKPLLASFESGKGSHLLMNMLNEML